MLVILALSSSSIVCPLLTLTGCISAGSFKWFSPLSFHWLYLAWVFISSCLGLPSGLCHTEWSQNCLAWYVPISLQLHYLVLLFTLPVLQPRRLSFNRCALNTLPFPENARVIKSMPGLNSFLHHLLAILPWKLTIPHCASWSNEDSNTICLIRLMWGLNEVIHVRDLESCACIQ